VEAATLSEMLSLAITPFAREWMTQSVVNLGKSAETGWGSWEHAAAQWVERLKEWMEAT
jgi:hypothetical protein